MAAQGAGVGRRIGAIQCVCRRERGRVFPAPREMAGKTVERSFTPAPCSAIALTEVREGPFPHADRTVLCVIRLRVSSFGPPPFSSSGTDVYFYWSLLLPSTIDELLADQHLVHQFVFLQMKNRQ